LHCHQLSNLCIDCQTADCSNKHTACSFRFSTWRHNINNAKLHHVMHTKSALQMGLFDFLNKREGDFIPLRTDDKTAYGPGPLLILYAIPSSIDDEELSHMIEDGMPNRRGVAMRRISGVKLHAEGGFDSGDVLLDMSVQDALNLVMKEGSRTTSCFETNTQTPIAITDEQYLPDDPCPVLYFSGVTNNEMMDTYKIIANEVYEETNGVHWPACAKVVGPAMQKSLRQVLLEISGDHADAMRLRKEAVEGEG
jgi:hypothetical protein